MPLISVTQAAKLANTSRTRIYNAIERGELIREPGLPFVLLRSEEVEAFARRKVSRGGRPRKQQKGEVE
jgi:hypothetical protein